jgi:hypothetical protein
MKRVFTVLISLQLLFSILAGAPAAQAAACTTPTQGSLTDGGVTYITQTFTNVSSNCTWTVPASVSQMQLLIVGGGGGAGFGSCGGGGGAGRVIVSNSFLNVVGGSDISVTIGDGGIGGFINSSGSSWRDGTDGGVSSVTVSGTAYQASGGGGGGGGAAYAGRTGGSGGGGTACGTVGSGGSAATSAITGFTTYQNSGATGNSNGGGGGGAGAAATNSDGGAGVTVWGITLAGGGGGWGGGAGGSGGGGTALRAFDTKANSGNPGTNGLGAGGGGGNNGGSGRIVIRYLADSTAPTITGPASATGATSAISISENATAVHTFTANESVTWSKSGTDGSFFTISSGGALTITSCNFESPADSGGDNTYVVIVTATDAALNAKNQTVTVMITNVNEAPTISINGSGETHTITQAENIASVLTYTANDVDAGSSLSFSISGTDAADFAINSSSGVLTFAANPDFEAPTDSDTNNTYVVVITVTDGAALTDTQTLTVTITNANESSSVGAPTLSGAASKGSIVTISVTTNAAGKVRFFVGGKRISTCLARSTTGSYPNFSATCSWKPPVTGSQNLTARVTPTDSSFSATTSATTSVRVIRRVNQR